MTFCGANVWLWHKADNPTAPAFVRYWSNSGHWSARALNGSGGLLYGRYFARRQTS